MGMKDIQKKIILALDVDDLKHARRVLESIGRSVMIVKVGPALFTAYGPKATDLVRRKGMDVFLDLKFHDIPSTIANAVRQAVRLQVKMLTLHVSGGEEMMRAAARSAEEEAVYLKAQKPLLLGVTVLTSEKKGRDTKMIVVSRARLAKKSGLDGVICSVHEAAAVRQACGNKFIIVTPGIRPKDSPLEDQKRVATAHDAFRAGADYIVVGRPILEAQDPIAAVKTF